MNQKARSCVGAAHLAMLRMRVSPEDEGEPFLLQGCLSAAPLPSALFSSWASVDVNQQQFP